jgi:hypothetical protein
VSSVVVEQIREGSARVRSYVTVVAPKGDELGITTSGTYDDELVRESGRWRIRERTGVFDSSAVLSSVFFR